MSYPNPISVVDIIGDIVNNQVNTAIIGKLQISDPTIFAINYQFGPPKEINETLTQMSGALQNKKYPLVAVYQPIMQKKSALKGVDSKANVRIIIARGSNSTDKAADRETKNFIPILRPVYAELMYRLASDRRIRSATWETMAHDYREWPYWDNDGKNPLIDFVDIIEISQLELNFAITNC